MQKREQHKYVHESKKKRRNRKELLSVLSKVVCLCSGYLQTFCCYFQWDWQNKGTVVIYKILKTIFFVSQKLQIQLFFQMQP